MSDLDGIDWEHVEITVVPDPLWTPEMEAAAQGWLALIKKLNGGELPGALPVDGSQPGTGRGDQGDRPGGG